MDTLRKPLQVGESFYAEPDGLRPMVEQIVGEFLSQASPPTPFTDFEGLARHVPFQKPRSLRQMIKAGVIPVVRPPGSRKLGFHLPSVEAALLRFQRGGI